MIYPNDGLGLDQAIADGVVTQADLDFLENDPSWQARQDELWAIGTFISYPCLVMECQTHSDQLLDNEQRYGIYLTDDGRTASWTLDGEFMKSFDLGNYWDSSPGIADDGLYFSATGAGVFKENTFKMDDLKILTSDTNGACTVDIEDLATMAEDWLMCNNPEVSGCEGS